MITKRKDNLSVALVCFVFSLACLYILLFKAGEISSHNEPQIYATTGITFLINGIVALAVMGWACLTDKVRFKTNNAFTEYDEAKLNFYLPMLFLPSLVMVSIVIYTRAESLLFKILWSGIFLYIPYITIKYLNLEKNKDSPIDKNEYDKNETTHEKLSIKELVLGISIQTTSFLAIVYGTRYFNLPLGLTASLLMFLGFISFLFWNYKKLKLSVKVTFIGLSISSAILSILWAYKEFINQIRIDFALIIILIGGPVLIGNYLMKKEKINN